MYKVIEKIGDMNVYQYDYDYFDADTNENKQSFITFVDFNEVPENYKEDFSKWLYGQTMPMIPGLERNAVYSWDWERYYKMKTRGTPTYFD